MLFQWKTLLSLQVITMRTIQSVQTSLSHEVRNRLSSSGIRNGDNSCLQTRFKSGLSYGWLRKNAFLSSSEVIFTIEIPAFDVATGIVSFGSLTMSHGYELRM
jgi:hypothetical protein